MKKIYFALLIFISIFFINVFAEYLQCQYMVNNNYTNGVNFFYQNSNQLNYDVLEVDDIKQGNETYAMEFKVYNNYNQDVNVTIKYMFNGQLQSKQVLIAVDGYALVNSSNSPGLDEDSIRFDIITPGLESRFYIIEFENISCKECPEASGVFCFNDGVACNNSSECGGGHCIENYCSNFSICFNQDCRCDPNEVQCSDNTSCVKEASVQLGFKPDCSVEECISKYISSKTGNCTLRDGETCSINSDCESNLCIRDRCSNNPDLGTCYNNDCDCGEDEVQCFDNTTCVKKDSVGIGNKPLCTGDECKTEIYCSIWDSKKCISYKYLNNLTGNCERHPEIAKIKNREYTQILIISTSVLFVSGVIIFYFIKFKKMIEIAKMRKKAKKKS